MSLMKESSYDKVLINAANKDFLQKSELEYSNNLYLMDTTSGEKNQASVCPDLMRKLNLLTLKNRPKCAFSECVVGFRWYTNGEFCLNEKCFREGNYPKDCTKESFKEETLSAEIWE